MRPTRARWLPWVLIMAGVLTAATGLMLLLIGDTWEVADRKASVLGMAAGMSSLALGLLQELRYHRSARRVDAGNLADLAVVRSNGRLPRLTQVLDRDLGSTETRYTEVGEAPYVRRPAIDAELQEAIGKAGPPYPFILVVGRSKAGKSRTAVQAARTVFATTDPFVVLPLSGQALAALLGPDRPRALRRQMPALLWLDDLTATDLQHLTVSALHRAQNWAVIVATMTAGRVDEIERNISDVSRTARTALRQAIRLYLPFDLTDAEQAEANQLYPNENITGSLAETLVGARELLRKYDAGPDTNPEGYVIVQTAIDIRRAGVSRPATRAELRHLFPFYLRALRPDLDPTTVRFTLGLDWACRPVASHVALLRRPVDFTSDRTALDTFEPFDYVLSADDGNDRHPYRPIPDVLWRELLTLVTPGEMFDIGLAASLRDQPHTAKAAYSHAVKANHPEATPAAAFNLGRLLTAEGKVEEAIAVYQLAVDSNHDQAAPLAANNLGRLLKQQGRPDEAKVLYIRAVASGHTEGAVLASFNLGNLLEEQGDVEGAKIAYQRVIDSKRTDQAAEATVNLANLLEKQGDNEGAKAAYRQAVDSGHPDASPIAAFRLGVILERDGDVKGATAVYRQAVDSGHPKIPAAVANNLGVLLRKQAHIDEAQSYLQHAIDTDDRYTMLAALINLGGLLKERGDIEDAKAAYQRAIESDYRDAAATAQMAMGRLLQEQGDLEGAKVSYRLAMDYRHPDVTRIASSRLIELLKEHGDNEGIQALQQCAIDVYQSIIDAGLPNEAPKTALHLGRLLHEHGDIEGAKNAYQYAIDSTLEDISPKAAFELGRMIMIKEKDIEGAKANFKIALDSNHPDEAPMASWALGLLLDVQGDAEGARNAYQFAIDSGHPDAAQRARQQIDRLNRQIDPDHKEPDVTENGDETAQRP